MELINALKGASPTAIWAMATWLFIGTTVIAGGFMTDEKPKERLRIPMRWEGR